MSLHPVLEYHSGSNPVIDFDRFICTLWEQSELFRYKLDDVSIRILPGKYGFVLQRNPKRLTHRRIPHEMNLLQQPFNPEVFNFNKIDSKEVLFHVRRHTDGKVEDHKVIINVSPINYGHCLLIPHPHLCLPQVITEDSLELCMELISMSQRRGFCIVANSLLAYASVNHLHYHFLYIDQPLLAQTINAKPIINLHNKSHCYELTESPMPGFGFQMSSISSARDCARNVFSVIDVLLQENTPHNILMISGSSFSNPNDSPVTRIIVTPKLPAIGVKNICDTDKETPPFFPAALEVSGFIIVIDHSKYYSLTEEDILKQLNTMAITRDAFQKLKCLVIKKYSIN